MGGEKVPLLYRDATQNLRAMGPAIGRLRAGNTELSDLPGMIMVESLLARRTSMRAAARITRLGLAAIEFHQEQGQWPEDPSILEPRFRDGMPLDPVSGQFFPFSSDGEELTLSTSAALNAENDNVSWTLRLEP